VFESDSELFIHLWETGIAGVEQRRGMQVVEIGIGVRRCKAGGRLFFASAIVVVHALGKSGDQAGQRGCRVALQQILTKGYRIGATSCQRVSECENELGELRFRMELQRGPQNVDGGNIGS